MKKIIFSKFMLFPEKKESIWHLKEYKKNQNFLCHLQDKFLTYNT